jgi:lipid-A-disaccharide synthase-like uncharacterized protein
MHWTEILWLGIGFTAQAAYAGRFLLQWIVSERERRSVIPIQFWHLSVVAETLLLAYAFHRRDPVIVTGQLVGLAIYLRNIEFIQRSMEGVRSRSWFQPWLLLSLAAAVAGYAGAPEAATRALRVDGFWTLFGLAGQALFTSRFIVQWLFSERARKSVTPVYFWYLSISGSLMLLAYAIAIRDPVIIVGQAFGFVVYVRNLMLLEREKPVAART